MGFAQHSQLQGEMINTGGYKFDLAILAMYNTWYRVLMFLPCVHMVYCIVPSYGQCVHANDGVVNSRSSTTYVLIYRIRYTRPSSQVEN